VLAAGQAARGGGRMARLAGVALAAAAVSFAGIGSHSLWTPDEPRDAAVGKAMWTSGDLVVPRLAGRPFLEKPPLAWWAQAAAFRALGASDAAARVPSALFATLTLLATYALARRLGGERAGWLAAGALASTAQFGEDMRRAIVDPPLVLMVTLAYVGFAVLVTPGAASEDAHGNAERRGAYLLIVLAVPLAYLAKGVAGIALALGPPILYLLVVGVRAGQTSYRTGLSATLRLLGPLALIGVPLFVALVLPWALALLHESGWPALREVLFGNTFGRLLPTEAGRVYGHRQPFWYYLPAGSAALLPWTLALPAMLRGERARRSAETPRGSIEARRASAGAEGASSEAGRSPTEARRARAAAGGASTEAGRGFAEAGHVPADAVRTCSEAGRSLLIACFFFGVLMLSLAASKRSLYLVPLLPAIAVPIGLWLDRLGRAERQSWDRPTALFLLLLAGILPLILWVGAWEVAHRAFQSFPTAPLRAELTGARLAVAGVAAAASAALLLLRCVRHWRAGSTPSGPWLVVPYLILALAYQTAIKAAIDPLKNPHELTAAIARLAPGSAPVAAYRPSETFLGIVEFDLGRSVLALKTPGEVEALLGVQPAGRLVLSLDAWRHLPPALRARLLLLYDETPSKASPYAIAAWTSAR
jgi:4-amino-4-deoxy-L-arabinose transferase-like glycosyltransferase